MKTRLLRPLALACLLLAFLSLGLLPGLPQEKKDPDDKDKKPQVQVTPIGAADWGKHLSWRAIGPANMAGRITAISVYEADPSTYYVATASGGLLKTINSGVTFEHQFD